MTRTEKWLIGNMPRLGCALYAFKHAGDKDYVTKAVQTDSMVMRCKTFGKENSDKNIYLIEFSEKNNGFFAVYHKLLKHLYYADRFHFIPVVSYSRDFIYSEDHPVNGTDNPFEYYFIQPAGISTESAKNSRNVFRSEYIHTMIDDLEQKKMSDYDVSDEYIAEMGKIAHKYIKLNDTVSDKIENDIAGIHIDDNTIGVHYRGTDYKRGFTGHPRFTDMEEYIEKTKELLQQGRYNKVFLATDDSEVIGEFRAELGDIVVCFNDAYRSGGDVSVAFSKDSRDNHHYLLGLEVLRDMTALSRCGALVSGASQVSFAACVTKSGNGEKYQDRTMISHGVEKNGTDSRGYYRTYGTGR